MLALSVVTMAQTNETYQVSASKIHKLGKTPALRTTITEERIHPLAKMKRKLNKKRPDNFRGRQPHSIVRPELEHVGPDPIRQQQNGTVLNTPNLNIDGLFNEFGSPHDPTGDVGLNHYVQAINGTEVGVFDLFGNLLERFSTSALWAPFGKNGAGDPIILFDELEKRWMITEFDSPALVLIAISDTDDPLGTFNVYEFATPSFPDYPKYAIWPNTIVFTTNEEGAEVLHNYFIQKDSLYAGAENVSLQRIVLTGHNTETNFYVTTPIDFSGDMMPADQRPMVVRLNDSSWGNVPQDQVELFLFDINWADPNATQIEQVDLVTTPFDPVPCSAAGVGFACVPQLNGDGLDAIPEVIMNVPMFRRFTDHESVVLSFVTDVTNGENQSGIRWMELRRTDNTNWTIFQEGTYAPDDLDRYMCSIAIDRKGNIGLGYNVSSENTYVGVRYTGRLSTDPPGLMTIAEVPVVEGIGPIESNGRFGDYAQMSIAPLDALHFWFTTEYAGKENNSKTRIVSFQLLKNNVDVRPVQLIQPVSGVNLGNAQVAQVAVSNVGLLDVQGVKVELFFQGVLHETVVIGDTLSGGATKNVVFTNPLNFNGFGLYEIMAVATIGNDENTLNDTSRFVLNNYAPTDAAISKVPFSQVCTFPVEVPFLLKNTGIDTIYTASIETTLNGTKKDTAQIPLVLVPGASVQLVSPITNGQEGNNAVDLSILQLNGQNDQNLSNNYTNSGFNYTSDLVRTHMTIQLDSMPDEVFWYIFDEQAFEIIGYGGGNYTEPMMVISEDFCLKKNHCYAFQVIDSGENGLCCDAGEGSILVTGSAGETLVESDGQFQDIFIEQICTGDGCQVLVNIETVPVSTLANSDGIIIINILAGQAPFLFSIDGGTTFSESPVFNNLSPGTYQVVVQSQGGACTQQQTVVLGVVSGTNESAAAAVLEVVPNPGNGFYRLTISGLNDEGYILPVSVMDASGRNIQQFSVQRYGDTFKSDLSLLSYPSGVYYVKISTSSGIKIVKVIHL
jgi:hypothetical protein